MCGGLGRATTEQGTAPRTKGRWNIQFLKLLLLPNALPALPPHPKQTKFPPARDSFVVGVLFPSFLLAPNLPAAFQPTLSALVSVLLFVVFLPNLGTMFSPSTLTSQQWQEHKTQGEMDKASC